MLNSTLLQWSQGLGPITIVRSSDQICIGKLKNVFTNIFSSDRQESRNVYVAGACSLIMSVGGVGSGGK